MSQPTTTSAALHDLLDTYHQLNSDHVEVRSGAPTPIDFLRDVMSNRPVVYKGAALELPASKLWNVNYLLEKMEGREITVAQTPYGNADSAVVNEADGRTYFVMPYEAPESFRSFIDHLRQQKQNPKLVSSRVKYSQSRAARLLKRGKYHENNNIQDEYSPLAEDLGPGISWAELALRQRPDATNIWIGNEKSVSAMHKDNYENLYCQILGRKRFTLISPFETVCVGEQSLPQARYELIEDHDMPFKIVPEIPESIVHGWPTVDPDNENSRNKWWKMCRPIHAVLDPGDVLYLPAMWYHKVSQESGDDGICCAVNFWYDMEYSGPFYPSVNFIRSISLLSCTTDQGDEDDGI